MAEHTLAIEHLMLRLRPINRALRDAVDRQTQIAKRLLRPDVTQLCVTGDQVARLLDDVDHVLFDDRGYRNRATLSDDECAIEDRLRETSAVNGELLPLDRLSQKLDLSEFEQEAVLLALAPELDRSYERIYAYILDDLNRRYPCVELLTTLTTDSLVERLHRRFALSRFGRLRRMRVLQPCGDAPTESRQELRIAPGILEFLSGYAGDITSLFSDPAEAASHQLSDLPPKTDFQIIERLGETFREKSLEILGIWGPRHSYTSEMAFAVAAAANKRIREWSPPQTPETARDIGPNLYEAAQLAAALDSLLWIQTDALNEPGCDQLSDMTAALLATAKVPMIFTGTNPWRPARLLESHAYAEIELDQPGYDSRKTMWTRAFPEVDSRKLDDLAARFRVCGSQARAAANVARTQALVATNGHAAPIADHLESACSAVARQRTHRFGVVVKPKRGPDDLILPGTLHRSVMEVAQFYRVSPRVSEEWGFGRLTTGGGGIKALFTGESGTGKTLAAEVIAGQLNMPLLRVDLARVVSKWVGETEQNLESAFREAEDNHAVLFFDEADSLFGKRGEVTRGTDRYANLEVSYLLQRLEDYAQICILSSNLKDSIDSAFTRRFQIVLHFPKPELPERLRIWQIAFPKTAPLDPDVDFEILAKLDMTGASIVSAAQTAAFMALDKGSPTIAPAHIVEAIVRQYRREAKLLTSSDLGPYASLLQTC